jgi:hypothetical protein
VTAKAEQLLLMNIPFHIGGFSEAEEGLRGTHTT